MANNLTNPETIISNTSKTISDFLSAFNDLGASCYDYVNIYDRYLYNNEGEYNPDILKEKMKNIVKRAVEDDDI